MVHLSFAGAVPYVWAEGVGRHREPDPGCLLDGWPVQAVLNPRVPLWLPSSGARPLPSPEARACLGHGAVANRPTMTLRRFEWPALRVDLAYLALAPRPTLPGCVWGGAWAAWDALLAMARSLWEHGSVLPCLRPCPTGFKVAWRAVLDDPALAQAFAAWSGSVPGVLLAAGAPLASAQRRPQLRALLDAVVAALGEGVAAEDGAGAKLVSPGDTPVRRSELRLLSALGCRPRSSLAATRTNEGLRQRPDALARTFEPSEAMGYGLTVRFDLGRQGAWLRWIVTSPATPSSGPTSLSWCKAVAAGWVGAGAVRPLIAGRGPVARRVQDAAPLDELALDGAQLFSFLTVEAGQWHRQGVRVLLSRELVRQQGACASTRVGPRLSAGVGLDALYAVQWEALLAGSPLSVEELLRLADERRALVDLHGRYVLVMPGELSAATRIVRLALARGLPLGWLIAQGWRARAVRGRRSTLRSRTPA